MSTVLLFVESEKLLLVLKTGKREFIQKIIDSLKQVYEEENPTYALPDFKNVIQHLKNTWPKIADHPFETRRKILEIHIEKLIEFQKQKANEE